MEFTLWDILRNLVLAARWTVILSLVAFLAGGVAGLAVLLLRIAARPWLRRPAELYIAAFQGTPLLMQLFLVFFGLRCVCSRNPDPTHTHADPVVLPHRTGSCQPTGTMQEFRDPM